MRLNDVVATQGDVEGWVQIGRFVCDPGGGLKPFHVLFLHIAQIPFLQQAVGRRRLQGVRAATQGEYLLSASSQRKVCMAQYDASCNLLVEELLASGKLLAEKGIVITATWRGMETTSIHMLLQEIEESEFVAMQDLEDRETAAIQRFESFARNTYEQKSHHENPLSPPKACFSPGN